MTTTVVDRTKRNQKFCQQNVFLNALTLISSSHLHRPEVFLHFLWDASHEGELGQDQDLPRYYLLQDTARKASERR